jgi:hypothetical protein
VTYGHWLDRATSAIHAAEQAAATSRAAGHGDAAATIASRNLAYRRLVHLTDQLGGRPPAEVTTKTAEYLANSDTRLATTSPARVLGVGLRAAIADRAPAPAGDPPGGELPRHLDAAAAALGIAGDILASHLGPPTRPARTPEGQAVANGAGHGGAWADLAHLAGQLIELDRRLPAWLSRGRPQRTLRPVYQPAIDRMRWWTRSRYPTILQGIADRSTGQSVLRLLELAPPIERSAGPGQVGSLRDVIGVLDAARVWLHRYPGRARHSHAVAATRIAVTITTDAARLGPAGPVDAGPYAYQWSQVARRLQPLTGLDGGRTDPLVQELDAAADWLRGRVRAQLAAPAQTRAMLDAEWHAALPKILGKLPGLAAQLNHAVAAAARQGHLCVPQSELDLSTTTRGIFYAKSRWRKATAADDQVQELRDRLDIAARVPTNRERALRQALGDPAALARDAYPQRPARPQAAYEVHAATSGVAARSRGRPRGR